MISSVSQYNSTNYDDFDSFPNGITVITHINKHTIQNNAFPNDVCVVITIIPRNASSETSVLQIAYRDNTIKYRIHWTNTWYEWKTIASQ